jgi:2'-5' RNA ligase
VTRAFVAIRPPGSVLDAVEARTANVDVPGARRTPRAQWHITVQFLGDHADVDAVIGALQGLETRPGVIALNTAGPLGHEKRSLVFSIGLREGIPWLRALADEVAGRLAALGNERDERPLLPHLTLARCRRATTMTAATRAVGAEPIGAPWLVEEVIVYESRLRHGEPADHVVRAQVPLGA